jgi:hypothetical protein
MNNQTDRFNTILGRADATPQAFPDDFTYPKCEFFSLAEGIIRCLKGQRHD